MNINLLALVSVLTLVGSFILVLVPRNSLNLLKLIALNFSNLPFIGSLLIWTSDWNFFCQSKRLLPVNPSSDSKVTATSFFSIESSVDVAVTVASGQPLDIRHVAYIFLILSPVVGSMARRVIRGRDPLTECTTLAEFRNLSPVEVSGDKSLERFTEVYRKVLGFADGPLISPADFSELTEIFLRKVDEPRTIESRIVTMVITVLFRVPVASLNSWTIPLILREGEAGGDADRVVLSDIQQAVIDVLLDREEIALSRSQLERFVRATSIFAVRVYPIIMGMV
uniref:hypothetical protein n=1 Tax=Navicula tsukamotoi TaxID=2018706 RepID=UPI0020282C25|nr:hypothetical protein NDC64_mgp09 [Navicula tsukamotoi]QYB23119.1 hypothetical protein [Navicula tsukamotoi]